MSNIMWVDDRQDLVSNWIQTCVELGHQVVFTRSSKEGLEIARKNGEAIDLALLDLVMPDMGGRTLARELKPLMPKARQVLVTSYSDVDVEADVEDDEELEVIDRFKVPLPGYREEFRQFLDALLDGKKVGEQEIQEQKQKRRVRDITYDEFRNESLDGRLALNEEAHKDPEIAKILGEGRHYWVLVCGDEIRKTDNPKGVMKNADVVELARRKGFAPFQFFGDMDVDDFSPKRCGADLAGYPFIRLEIESRGTSKILDLHFDTGNPENFLNIKSLDGFIEKGDLNPIGFNVRGERFQCWRGTLPKVLIENHVIEETEIVHNIEVILVRDWESKCLVVERKCLGGKCTNWSESALDQRPCYFRQHGLLGRRLQQSTNRYVVISPEDSRVSLFEEGTIRQILKQNV